MSGDGSGGSSAPSSTTSNNTNTVIQQVPEYEQQYLENLLGQASTIAAQPYQQFPGQQVAGFAPDQTQAFSNIEDLANNGSWNTSDAAATGSALAGANSASSIYGVGAPDVQASTSYNPLAAASPFLGAAANTATPQGIQSYLSPYTNDVVSGLVNTANQNWNNNILPSVNDAFIGSGQFASGRNATVLGQQANTFEQNLEGSVSNALESGYNEAGTLAGQQASILGNAANTASSATQAQAANLQNAGTALGNLASTQAGAQGTAATNLANTGQQTLNSGITAASALQDVGQQQQQLAQTNINTAEQNFQNQSLWPQQQAGFLSNIIQGLPYQGAATTTAGQTPTTTNQVGSVSPLSTLGGTILGASGLGAKRGGLIGYKKGGQVAGYAPGGLIDDAGPQVDADDVDMSGANAMPPETQSPLPLPPTSNPPPVDDQNPVSTATNSPSATIQGSRLVDADANGNAQSPLAPQDTSPQTPNDVRNYQLLAMARGLLTPAHSGAEALGNALGGYEDVGLHASIYEGQQQDVIGKQLGNAQNYASLARQNVMNQSLGFPTMPLPNIPGLAGYGQQVQQAMGGQAPQQSAAPSQIPSATISQNNQFRPIPSPQLSGQQGAAPQQAGMNIMQALQIANGRVPANEQQKYQAVVTLQGAQFPVPPAMAEEAKQYAQDSGKLGNAQALASATSQGELPAKIQAERSGFQMLRGAGNLPSSLYDPTQGKIVAEGAQQGIVPIGQPGAGTPYRLPPSGVGMGQAPQQAAQDASPSGNLQGLLLPNAPPASAMPSGAVQTGLAPQQEELLKQGTADMIEKQRPAYEAAQQTLNGSGVIDANIDKLGNKGWFAPGTGAAARLDIAKGFNTTLQAAGFDPDKNPSMFFDPSKVATGEELNKQTVNLGFNLARTMGARESQQVVEQAIKINPGLGTTYLGGKMVNGLIAENAQRTKDQYEYKMNALNNGIDPLTAETQFNKQYPGTAYVKRAVSQFNPIQVNDAPWTTKNLLPGTVVQYKKSTPKALPVPQDYQFSMPPTNKQFGAQQ